jgi:hypothetical protein
MGTGWWRGWLPRLRGAARRARTGAKTGEGRPGGDQAPGGEADHETAELTTSYWRAYDERMATVRFSDVGRRSPR